MAPSARHLRLCRNGNRTPTGPATSSRPSRPTAGLEIAAWYTENECGAKLARPELFRLLADAQSGDILLVEQADRFSGLTSTDWETLKAELTAKRIRLVALDLPTSWMMATANRDEFAGRIFEAINSMLLDMLAAVARKDYEDRRRRKIARRAKQAAQAQRVLGAGA